jgi:hypothetical protein
MLLAAQQGFRTVAFPSISTGAFCYPIREAAPVAVQTIVSNMTRRWNYAKVILVAYSQEDFDVIQSAIAEMRIWYETKLAQEIAEQEKAVIDIVEAERGPIIRFTGRLVEAQLRSEGHPGGLGFCHSIWRRQKMMLWQERNWDWWTPAERNPGVFYD